GRVDRAAGGVRGGADRLIRPGWSHMASITDRSGFVPPPYPYDRLDRFKPLAERLDGGLVDLSIGTPIDPPPDAVIAALGSSDAERGYPASIGSLDLRTAAQRWIGRR